MKQLRKLLLSAAIICSSLLLLNPIESIAENREEYNLYPMSCSAFEVDEVTDSGQFQNKGCFNDIGSAKQKMYEVGVNGVVRHSNSYSPTKIIMMHTGVVYSYPQRVGKNTSNIRQFHEPHSKMKTTYVTVHREMAYNGTWTFDSSAGDGQVGVYLNGFDGFINLKEVDLVPIKFIQNHLTIYLGGNSTYGDASYIFYREAPFLTHVYQDHFEVIQNGNYRDLVYISHSGWANPKSSNHEPQEWRFVIGPAASWMVTGAKYYSKDGYTFYNDGYYGNLAGVYYSYYQFLPLRSKSKINVGTYDSFLQSKGYGANSKLWGMGQTFIDAQNMYGVNATAVYALACLESAYGTSEYALKRNNLFGWNAFDSNPNAASYFPNIAQAINEHMGINLRGFLDIEDFRYFGGHLGNKGSGLNVKYAGDSYWGMKIAAIAYEIDKFNNGYSGNLTDFNSSVLANITNDTRIDILNSPNGIKLYNSAYGSTYQKNHILTVLEDNGDWYKIQSTNILKNGVLKPVNYKVGLINYDWNTNVGWIRKSSLTLLNDVLPPLPQGNQPTGDVVRQMDAAKWSDHHLLILEGKNYRPGIYVDKNNQAIQTLEILDMQFKSVKKVEAVTTLVGNDQMNWQTKIDLSDMTEGSYLFKMSTVYSKYSQYNDSYYIFAKDILSDTQVIGDKEVHLELLEKEDNNLLKLEISKISCGENAIYNIDSGTCTCNEGFENWNKEVGCTAISKSEPDKDEQDVEKPLEILQVIKSTKYDEKDQIIKFSGVAFFEGLNAGADADITETLLLVNMRTGEKIELETSTRNSQNPTKLADGVDYTRSEYEAVVHLDTIAKGNYYFKIRVKNGEKELEKLVVSKSGSADLKPISFHGLRITLEANPRSTYLLEMNMETAKIDFEKYHRAVEAISEYYPREISINGNGTLNIEGFAFMKNTYTNHDNNPEYKIIVVDEEGKSLSFDAKNYSCPFNIAEIRKSKYTVDYACFTSSVDLKQLEKGQYQMYLEMQVVNEQNTFNDIIEMYDVRENQYENIITGNRKVHLGTSAVRDRYELTIK